MVNPKQDFKLKEITEAFISKEINKNEFSKLITSLLENCDDEVIKIDCIKLLEKYSIHSKEIFKLLEFCLISDKSTRVKITALEFIKRV